MLCFMVSVGEGKYCRNWGEESRAVRTGACWREKNNVQGKRVKKELISSKVFRVLFQAWEE